MTLTGERGVEKVDQTLGIGLDERLTVGVGQHNDKLVAADPGQDVGRTHGHRQLSGHIGNQCVAASVAGRVVNQFEIVQIDE